MVAVALPPRWKATEPVMTPAKLRASEFMTSVDPLTPVITMLGSETVLSLNMPENCWRFPLRSSVPPDPMLR